ncbi:hypothetical protein AJ79_01618 [Helicocarpus griseus UAMH5409]|uniref:Diaminohydroxyphosphoribosylamino-pyrimidine deaminase n=1 Tax=Helicocarpus griseus UAMH5409 TaxID=1447875 RepID=A0A2B7Y6B4_9EURO|nr:hypothetical protein AJ79_01618 [Helicocarpus griseus UAMH5409]
MQFQGFLQALGPEIEDAEEDGFLGELEAFSLFSQEFPSQNLGFIDSHANSIDLTIHGRDFEIRQSPTILSSARSGGTTGAVLWKITPLIAEWLSSKQNTLWTSSILSQDSTIVELGCGISGLIALSLAPSVGHYIATDQDYVQKLLKENLDANCETPTRPKSRPVQKSRTNERRSRKPPTPSASAKHSPSPSRPQSPDRSSRNSNITFAALDWELDSPSTLKQVLANKGATSSTSQSRHSNNDSPARKPAEQEEHEEDLGFDLVLACDCIYNDALIEPFVQTCADICRLRPGFTPSSSSATEILGKRPTVCIIAQQLRAPDVFESWLQAALGEFWVWRVCDEVVGKGLAGASGYVVHVLVLREE